MTEPFFSIIIPTYNRANIILNTIESVLNQTHTNFELLVIDDGSTDNTKDIVRKISDKRLEYFKKENAERGAARNYGISRARGNYITFLDSDDLFYIDHLEKAYKFIEENQVGVFFQGYEIINNQKKTKQIFSYKYVNKALLKYGNIMSCHGVFLKNKLIKQNLFNEDYELSGLEDYELWLRIAAKQQIFHNPIVTSCLINHENRSVLEINKEKLIKRNMLFLKYVFENELTKEYCKPYKNYIISNIYSYIALHLILSKSKKSGVHYFVKSIWIKPSRIFTRRSMAVLKHFLFR